MKLFKRQDRYDLYADTDHKVASSAPNPFGKLSKQNCDEVFGVVDVEKLAEEYDPNYAITDISNGFHFIEGFNKALELNKDKLFTLYEIKEAIRIAQHIQIDEKGVLTEYKEEQILRMLQQPTEIEVEIVTETREWIKKLDSNGNLILKKI
jgi:hypothetical protein